MKANHQPVLRIQDLRKTFGEQVVLDGVNLEVQAAETLAVLGRSGTGKSILLKLIIGLQKPDSGTIVVGNVEICRLGSEQLDEVRKKIGFLFQHAALYDSLTVEENVAFPLRRHKDMPDQERMERVHELLSLVGMEQASQKMPAEISGGMRKRVGLARALALDPELILMDEPTAGLDPMTSAEIHHLIRELQQKRKTSSVVVTHETETVRDVSDRIAILHEGSILIQGTFDELRGSRNSFVAAFLKQGNEERRDV